MKGINVYSPVLGALMIIIAVAFSTYIIFHEKTVIKSVEDVIGSVKLLQTADIVLYDVITTGVHIKFEEASRKLGKIRSVPQKWESLVPVEDELEVLSRIKFAAGNIVYTTRRYSTEVNVWEGNFTLVKENRSSEVTFSYRDRSFLVKIGDVSYVLPIRLKLLHEVLTRLNRLSLDMNLYQGFFVENNSLCFRKGSIKWCEGVDGLCNVPHWESRAEDLEESVKALLPYIEKNAYWGARRVSLAPLGYLLTDCSINGDPLKVKCTELKFEPLNESNVYDAFLGSFRTEPTGLKIKAVKCTFTLTYCVPGVGHPLSTVFERWVPVVDRTNIPRPASPISPSLELNYQSGCYTLR